MNAARKSCAECGAELADDAVRGLCPRCLLQAGLGSQPDPDATIAFAGGAGRSRTLPEAGERFGPYRILRLLGRGGMGVVFEAEEQDTGRRVALKVLGRQFDSPSDRARFLREGRLAASINHPNSVYVYGTEEIDGTPTIAMELVSGGTLQERVKDRGPLPVPVAVEAILDIISGLEAAQAIGILHRDIKPGNCFEDSDGAIKIGDFGLSISTAGRAEANLTASGASWGPPRSARRNNSAARNSSARSDMYSVGGTLFYLLTGACRSRDITSRSSLPTCWRNRCPRRATSARKSPRAWWPRSSVAWRNSRRSDSRATTISARRWPLMVRPRLRPRL